MAQDPEKYTRNEKVDAMQQFADSALSLRGPGFKNFREGLELMVNVASGSPYSKSSLDAKQLLDPYKKTYPKEFYDDLIVNIKKDNEKAIDNLMSQLPRIEIKAQNVVNKINNEYKDGNLTKSEASRLIPYLPTIEKVDYGDKLEDKLKVKAPKLK